MDKFILVNGNIKISNTEIKLDIDRFEEMKNKLYFILFPLTWCVDYFEPNLDFLKTNYFRSIIFIMLSIFIIYTFFYMLFFMNWSRNINITSIKKIFIDYETENKHEIEIDIVIKNNRNQIIKFRKKENMLEPFIDSLKKRNSRIIIDYIK